MASILKRRRKDGTTAWQVQTRIPGQPSICKTFNDETQARSYAVESDQKAFSSAGREKRFSPSSFYGEKFADVVRQFLLSDEATASRKNTGASVLPHLGNVTVGQLNQAFVQNYIKTLQKKQTHFKRPFKLSTIASHLCFMSVVYAWYGREYNIFAPSDLFSTKNLPKGWNDFRERRLSFSEEQSIFQEFKNPNRPHGQFWTLLIKLALETGARLQELIFSRWEEFNLDQHVWTIPKEHTKCRRTRYVPLSVVASEVLEQLRVLHVQSSDRLFHCFIIPQRVSMAFSRMIKKLGISNFHFHDLRHEAVSRMVMQRRSMSTYEIMKIVGHNSIQMLDRYANLRADEMVDRFRIM